MTKDTADKAIEKVLDSPKKDDSIWEIVSVTTQTAPAIHNKVTDEVLTEQQSLVRILEGIDFIKRRVG